MFFILKIIFILFPFLSLASETRDPYSATNRIAEINRELSNPCKSKPITVYRDELYSIEEINRKKAYHLTNGALTSVVHIIEETEEVELTTTHIPLTPTSCNVRIKEIFLNTI